MIVAIQGEPGSFSEAVVRSTLGDGVEIIGFASFGEVFTAVDTLRADLAVLPTENSIFGPVADNRDRIDRGGYRILESTWFPVQQCLIARPGTRLEEIRRVASHPVAIGQCGNFLRRYPHWSRVEVADTAGSVRALMEAPDGAPGGAAIASALAASRYGAEVLVPAIQDDPTNATRFLAFTPLDGMAPRTLG